MGRALALLFRKRKEVSKGAGKAGGKNGGKNAAGAQAAGEKLAQAYFEAGTGFAQYEDRWMITNTYSISCRMPVGSTGRI